jgi:hypothetical protein
MVACNFLGKSWTRNTDGEASMTKEEALAAIKLLSALESWAMSQAARLPDYVHEDLTRSMEVLERIVLEDNLDNMSAMNKRPLKEYP